jgi:hypothetical protein
MLEHEGIGSIQRAKILNGFFEKGVKNTFRADHVVIERVYDLEKDEITRPVDKEGKVDQEEVDRARRFTDQWKQDEEIK